MVKRAEDQARIRQSVCPSVRRSASKEDGQAVSYCFDRGLFLGRERIGDIAVHVDLTQDGVAPANQDHQLGAGEGVAGDVILDRRTSPTFWSSPVATAVPHTP